MPEQTTATTTTTIGKEQEIERKTCWADELTAPEFRILVQCLLVPAPGQDIRREHLMANLLLSCILEQMFILGDCQISAKKIQKHTDLHSLVSWFKEVRQANPKPDGGWSEPTASLSRYLYSLGGLGMHTTPFRSPECCFDHDQVTLVLNKPIQMIQALEDAGGTHRCKVDGIKGFFRHGSDLKTLFDFIQSIMEFKAKVSGQTGLLVQEAAERVVLHGATC